MTERIDYELTVKFKLSSFDGPVDPRFALALNQIFDDCCDGRRPFDAEMIMEGMHKCMKQAAYQVNQREAFEKYGDERIEQENGDIRRWCVEADKMPLWAPYTCDSPTVKIERIT